MEFLIGLLTAGGISALVVGVLYLLYREMIRRDVFSRMKPWQTFAFFCLVAVLIFSVVLVVLLEDDGNSGGAGNSNAKPPSEHFQADSRFGLFCENYNVFSEFVTYYNFAQVQASDCDDASKEVSIGFSVRNDSGQVFETSHQERSGFRACHTTDFPDFARKLYENANESLSLASDQDRGCSISVSGVTRVWNVKYTDINGDPKETHFGLTYHGPDDSISVHQVSSNSVAKPSDWAIMAVTEGNVLRQSEAERVAGFFD